MVTRHVDRTSVGSIHVFGEFTDKPFVLLNLQRGSLGSGVIGIVLLNVNAGLEAFNDSVSHDLRSPLRQVFANLLANAVKFTRKRRSAVIEVGRATLTGRAVFFVRDNRVGFSMKYADTLFGVFERLHRREDFEGTGVGLVTVPITHKHGGRIWAEAELEKGATSYFTLDMPIPDRPRPELSEQPAVETVAVAMGGD